MSNIEAYKSDLAYVHDQGYGGFARDSAPGLLALLRQAGIERGRVVDLGCGSGIWAGELLKAGYQVVGVDLSGAMIEIARRRAPEAELHLGSFLQFSIPPCQAVTALGEVFNYLFDADNSLGSLQQTCQRIFTALSPGGMLIFDVAEPGRNRGLKQAFREGDDWTCLVEFQHDDLQQQLVRRIVTFRKLGDAYRRSEETHRQQLFDEASVSAVLKEIGFRAETVRSYGDHPLADAVVGFVAHKP